MAEPAATFLTLLLYGCLVAICTQKDIVLDNNGRYNDVLIALSDDIPEDWSLVDKLKSGFQAASETLAVASQIKDSGPFTFGQVYILVPRSWVNASVGASATWQSEDVAHFRVGQRGNTTPPHTVQPQGCGKPGLFVNLHRGYLLDVETSVVGLGKQLAHEFAHLRWGVFDEFNGDEGPHAYLDRDSRIQGVRCSRLIQGYFGHKKTGAPCQFNSVTLSLEHDCIFIEYEGQTVQDSLMYDTTNVASVHRFCSDLSHNSVAPNSQNRLCHGRSVQSVILGHPDYNRTIDSRGETNRTVNFTLVQRREARRLVIVMDVSGSMRVRLTESRL